jgi:UDP-glucose 4-epimerase
MKLMEECWLVTGGCGFIGVNLVHELVRRGAGVRVLDNLSEGRREDLAAVLPLRAPCGDGLLPPGTAELMVGDVRDPAAAAAAVRGVDVVVHLAAQTGVIPSVEDPFFDCEQNVTGTLTMLQAARDAGTRRFVFASSSAPLGDQDPPVHEGKVPRPLSPYGASKLAGEAYCSAFSGSFGLSTVALRFSNAYGPRSFRKGSVIALFFRCALEGEPLVVFGDGSQTRDFVHTDDLCRAVILAGEAKDAGGGLFQIGTGEETAVNDLVERTASLAERDLGRKLEVRFEPARKGEIARSVCDITRARKVLGFEPLVTLAAGLQDTWAWFRSV